MSADTECVPSPWFVNAGMVAFEGNPHLLTTWAVREDGVVQVTLIPVAGKFVVEITPAHSVRGMWDMGDGVIGVQEDGGEHYCRIADNLRAEWLAKQGETA